MGKIPKIVPVTELRQEAAAVLRRVRDSGEPVFITQRGRAAAVVMSAEAFENSENEREILRLIARGEKEIKAGKGPDLPAVMAKGEALLKENPS
ncbi:MAG: type II toxin-antitoxin system Phd/YefM family antitoxin [Candidatus Aminicenantes bacterium]|nr:type II toxin-antitoxin system Phd/YefM family antitoxin [Candidatus Aminicenantes bacterium]